MDDKFEAILKNLPSKEPRSRLEPYRELITEMRKRGRAYREIAHVLKKACGLTVGASTVNDFVLAGANSKAKTSPSISRTTETKKNMEGLTGTYKNTEACEGTVRPQKGLEGICKDGASFERATTENEREKTFVRIQPGRAVAASA